MRPRPSDNRLLPANRALSTVKPVVASIWLVGIPPRMLILGLSGFPIVPGRTCTSGSSELPQKFNAFGLVVAGGLAQERAARTRAILGRSQPVRCALRSTVNTAV